MVSVCLCPPLVNWRLECVCARVGTCVSVKFGGLVNERVLRCVARSTLFTRTRHEESSSSCYSKSQNVFLKKKKKRKRKKSMPVTHSQGGEGEYLLASCAPVTCPGCFLLLLWYRKQSGPHCSQGLSQCSKSQPLPSTLRPRSIQWYSTST